VYSASTEFHAGSSGSGGLDKLTLQSYADTDSHCFKYLSLLLIRSMHMYGLNAVSVAHK
jgi:hypothetical protein